MNVPFKTIALIGKHKNLEVVEPLLRLAEYLRKNNFVVVIDQLTASQLPKHEYQTLTLDEIGQQVDLAVVIGGDGTMLNIARKLVSYDVPLIGVNQGRLGFLTDLSIDTMLETLSAMLEGAYVTERRMLLNAEVLRTKECSFNALAFNDVVIYRGASSGMIEFEVRINDEYVYSLRSDGLIVATPTGSTAYALSSGGPILHPSLDLIALVPVCPHTLSNRPIVVGPDASVEILVHCSSDLRVHCDSHSHFDLEHADRIIVQRFPETVRLLHSTNHSYYRMLREKLGWSEFP
ncbi:MAG: NAD kinase [Nitrosomonas sp.]|nr:NAD kinase [Nitrosomonas sp.]MDP1950269.1 NAD kinase [Nitrosomonas sp.]